VQRKRPLPWRQLQTTLPLNSVFSWFSSWSEPQTADIEMSAIKVTTTLSAQIIVPQGYKFPRTGTGQKMKLEFTLRCPCATLCRTRQRFPRPLKLAGFSSRLPTSLKAHDSVRQRNPAHQPRRGNAP
jgi:hypothetical protein